MPGYDRVRDPGCIRGVADVALDALGLRGFFAVVARRVAWRLPVFFVVAGACESGAV